MVVVVCERRIVQYFDVGPFNDGTTEGATESGEVEDAAKNKSSSIMS